MVGKVNWKRRWMEIKGDSKTGECSSRSEREYNRGTEKKKKKMKK